MNSPNNNKLPEKASDLIKLAMDEFIKFEKASNYNIDMEWWYNIDENSICNICFAGAIIAGILVTEEVIYYNDYYNDYKDYKNWHIIPEDYDDYTCFRLYALDNFREGYIIEGLNDMDIELNETMVNSIEEKYYIPSNISEKFRGEYNYKTNSVKWKEMMYELAEFFKSIGL